MDTKDNDHSTGNDGNGNRGPGNTWRKGALGCVIVALAVVSLTACNASDTSKYDAGAAGHSAAALFPCGTARVPAASCRAA